MQITIAFAKFVFIIKAGITSIKHSIMNRCGFMNLNLIVVMAIKVVL
jgi:hypothetical protein